MDQETEETEITQLYYDLKKFISDKMCPCILGSVLSGPFEKQKQFVTLVTEDIVKKGGGGGGGGGVELELVKKWKVKHSAILREVYGIFLDRCCSMEEWIEFAFSHSMKQCDC